MSLKSKNFFHIILFLAVILGVLTYILVMPPVTDSSTADSNPYSRMGGDFTLQSERGDVSLSDFKDKIVILYFGYTFCPDVCPTSLGLLSLALGKLDKSELEKIQGIFISVDPERDTPEKVMKYSQAFHPNIIGLTGKPDNIARTARQYGAVYMKVDMPNSAMGYAVDHSSRYYVIGPGGEIIELLQHGTEPEKIIISLRKGLDVLK